MPLSYWNFVCESERSFGRVLSAQSKLSGFAVLCFRFGLIWTIARARVVNSMHVPNTISKRQRERERECVYLYVRKRYNNTAIKSTYMFDMALETMDPTASINQFALICQTKAGIWAMWKCMNEIDWRPNENQHFCCYFCCCCGWWRIKCRLISFYLQLFCVLSLDFMWAFIDCLFLSTFHGFFSVNMYETMLMHKPASRQASTYQQYTRFKCIHTLKYIYFTQIALPYPPIWKLSPRQLSQNPTGAQMKQRQKEGQTQEWQKVLRDSSPYRINVVKALTLCTHTHTNAPALKHICNVHFRQ